MIENQDKAYLEWAKHHAALFGYGPGDVEMVKSWVQVFKQLDYTPTELMDASTWMFGSPERPRWKGDHSQELIRRIQSERRRRLESEATQSRKEQETKGPYVKVEHRPTGRTFDEIVQGIADRMGLEPPPREEKP